MPLLKIEIGSKVVSFDHEHQLDHFGKGQLTVLSIGPGKEIYGLERSVKFDFCKFGATCIKCNRDGWNCTDECFRLISNPIVITPEEMASAHDISEFNISDLLENIK